MRLCKVDGCRFVQSDGNKIEMIRHVRQAHGPEGELMGLLESKQLVESWEGHTPTLVESLQAENKRLREECGTLVRDWLLHATEAQSANERTRLRQCALDLKKVLGKEGGKC